MQITLPSPGENIESGKVVSLLVKEGDTVNRGDPLLELETDKAVLEIPSPAPGTIESVQIQEGVTIHVGELLFELKETENSEDNRKTESHKKPKTDGPIDASGESLVSDHSRDLSRENSATESRQEKSPGTHGEEKSKESFSARGTAFLPPVKTGDESIQDRDDSKRKNREPESAIRRITRESVEKAWREIPHVTSFDEARIDSLLSFRQMLKEQEKSVTVTSLLVKTVSIALQHFPEINAVFHPDTKEIEYKKVYHIGVAVDTPAGLLVPVIQNADRKGIFEINDELAEKIKKARDRKLTPDEMSGGTFSLSNPGPMGGIGFTPIIRPPEAAILGVSAARVRLEKKGDQFLEYHYLPLSLSYDHRIIDGAPGTRFLHWICEALEHPWLLES